MANNRMYLTCRVCGQGVLLAKYYPIVYRAHNKDLSDRLDTFFEEHQHLDSDDDIDIENGFKLKYEHSRDDQSEEI